MNGMVSSTFRRSSLPRRPAVGAAVCFIVGIIAHPLLPHWGFVWIVIALVCAGAGLALFRRADLSVVMLAMAIVVTGVAAAQHDAYFFPKHDISGYATDQPRLARLELQLDRPLRVVGTSFDPSRRPMPPRQVTTARVVRVLTTSGWRDAAGDMLVSIDPPIHSLAIGQRIEALGMLQRPSPAMNPGQFDW